MGIRSRAPGRVSRGLLALTLGLSVCTAFAADIAGVRLDDKVSAGNRELVLNGAGVRSRAIFKVYVAGLYLPGKTADVATVLAAPARRVELHLLRKLGSDQLLDALNEGLRANNGESDLLSLKSEVDQLAAIMRGMKDVKEGDVVVIDFADGATHVLLNGDTKGSIPGAGFNRALMKVWLGEHPVQSDLKKAMLGG
ncbi:MAG: chalcone isomerase family protein [Pseudomonadota bacterium]|nr:chalcone isomerase family protein [Pseudomonadota bacterium]